GRRAPSRAAAARTLCGSRPWPSQAQLHAIPGDFDATARQLRRLAGVFIQDGVRVIHVNQNASRARGQLVEPFQHPTGTALGQMADLARTLAGGSEPDHLVIRPEGAVEQHTGRGLHVLPEALVHAAQTWRVDSRASRQLIGDHERKVVPRYRVFAIGGVGRGLALDRQRLSLDSRTALDGEALAVQVDPAPLRTAEMTEHLENGIA